MIEVLLWAYWPPALFCVLMLIHRVVEGRHDERRMVTPRDARIHLLVSLIWPWALACLAGWAAWKAAAWLVSDLLPVPTPPSSPPQTGPRASYRETGK